MCGITPAEHRQRMEALQNLVQSAGFEVFIVSAFDSIYYLTGAGFEPLERPFFLLVRPVGRPTLLVPKLDHEHMKKARNIDPDDIRTYREYPAPPGECWPDRLRDEIGAVQDVGIEPTMRVEIARHFRDVAPRAEALVETLRLVKSTTEIALIARTARYADFAIERLLATAYAGASVAEGFAQARAVNARIIREVENWEPLTTKVLMAIWAAPQSAMPHSIPGLHDRLNDGPHVALAFHRVNGYAAECERTFFTTPPTADLRTAYCDMLAARQLALDLIRPGAPCEELDGRVNAFLAGRGYASAEQRLHRLGHGIGLHNHEGPWLAEGSTDRLAEDMVISIEPGIYLPGVGGFRHSDTVRVTANSYELLTRFPVDMESLTIRSWRPVSRLRGSIVRRRLGFNRGVASAAR